MDNEITNLNAYTTPQDVDVFPIVDISAGISGTKKITWATIKSALASVFVPTSRTVNGHDLSANVTVTASDVGAPAGSGTSTGSNTGDQTSIVGITGTLTEFNNALTGADFATGGGTATGTNTGDNAANTTSNTYADGKVADAITDGVTTIAPSQNAVFDALALKIDKTQNVLIKDPTGFKDPESVVVTYDSTARTVTLTGTVEAYYQGTLVSALVSGWVSAAHTATNGAWFLYYNGSSFIWSQTPWTFDMLHISFVNYGTSDKFALHETHGLMPWQTHYELHNTIGTYLGSGGDLSSYVLASTTAGDRRPTVSSTVINDEDLQTTNAALSSDLFTQAYLAGAGATRTFAVDAAEIVPVSGSQPYYNQFTGGAWQQTLMGASSYQSIWLVAVPAASDATSQKYRYLWIQGQTNPGTLAAAQAEISSGLTLGNFSSIFTEFVFIGKVIIGYSGGNWTIAQVDKLTGTRISSITAPAGNYLSTVTTDSSLSGAGTAGSPLAVVTPLTAQNEGNLINGATSKTTPVDADMIGLMDSAASNILKKLSWLNLKATLKTYFDTLYQVTGSYITSGGALGTPSSGTLTNCSGLPVANITSSTSAGLGVGTLEIGHASDTTLARVAPGVASIEGNAIVVANSSPTLGVVTTTGNIELGHATDTTLARSAAGQMTIEGVQTLTASNTVTVTGKRNQPRVVSAASYTTDTGTSLDFATCNIFIVTAQAGALKFNNPSGSPVQGEPMIIRIKDNGTARALTYDTQYRAIGVTLPTSTVANKTTYIGGTWNATDTKLDITAVANEV